MTKVLVLYYSMYGHLDAMAAAVAEGARGAGAEVTVKRVPETMTAEQLSAAGAGADRSIPEATVEELADYDAIILGTPTRFGNMAGQVRTFLDRTGGLWAKGALIGKAGSVFTSTGTGGGNESTILTAQVTLLHHGMVIVGLPYATPELTDVSQVRGGSPYGAGMIAGPDGSRQASAAELAMARAQGAHVAGIAAKLAA